MWDIDASFLIYYFTLHKVTFIKGRIYDTSIYTVWTSVQLVTMAKKIP